MKLEVSLEPEQKWGPSCYRLDPRAGILKPGWTELLFSLNRNIKKLVEPWDQIKDSRGDLEAQMCWIFTGTRKK